MTFEVAPLFEIIQQWRKGLLACLQPLREDRRAHPIDAGKRNRRKWAGRNSP